MGPTVALLFIKFLRTSGTQRRGILKGGVHKTLKAKNKHFSSLLILLLSVASIKRKLLKTTHTNSESSKVATFESDLKKSI